MKSFLLEDSPYIILLENTDLCYLLKFSEFNFFLFLAQRGKCVFTPIPPYQSYSSKTVNIHYNLIHSLA